MLFSPFFLPHINLIINVLIILLFYTKTKLFYTFFLQNQDDRIKKMAMGEEENVQNTAII